ncbi:hypothetical protein SDC9_50575 [bioreactor metagenome]|uniref:Uncharacterized protein n=1 Tax=bioreactor metagenome TaxID=1076179 RepID=A0A644WL02_9ZZZZ
MVTTYGRNIFMDHIFHTAAEQELPASYYIGLSTTTPTESGTNFTEPPEESGYVRIILTGLTNSLNGAIQNGTVLSFPESTGGQGTITHWGIFDSSENGDGNLILFGELQNSRIVEAETTLSFKAGYMKLELINHQ